MHHSCCSIPVWVSMRCLFCVWHIFSNEVAVVTLSLSKCHTLSEAQSRNSFPIKPATRCWRLCVIICDLCNILLPNIWRSTPKMPGAWNARSGNAFNHIQLCHLCYGNCYGTSHLGRAMSTSCNQASVRSSSLCLQHLANFVFVIGW